MTQEELELALETYRQEHVYLGFPIPATRPDRYGSVYVGKFHNDSPYREPYPLRPYTVHRVESSVLTLDSENAARNLRDAGIVVMDDLLQELEGHIIDEQSFATLEEVDAFLQQMGKSVADIHRIPWNLPGR